MPEPRAARGLGTDSLGRLAEWDSGADEKLWWNRNGICGTGVLYEWRWTGWFGLQRRVVSVGRLHVQEGNVEGSDLLGFTWWKEKSGESEPYGYLKSFLSVPEWERVLETQNWSANLFNRSRKRGWSVLLDSGELGYLEVLWRERHLMIDACWFKNVLGTWKSAQRM